MSERNLKMKMGECTCDNCGVIFEKPLKELVRGKKLGRKNFFLNYFDNISLEILIE
jgi:hypothetical protein